jgi:hypothetical protein
VICQASSRADSPPKGLEMWLTFALNEQAKPVGAIYWKGKPGARRGAVYAGYQDQPKIGLRKQLLQNQALSECLKQVPRVLKSCLR